MHSLEGRVELRVHYVRPTMPKQYGIKLRTQCPRLKSKASRSHKEWCYSMASTVCLPDPGCITPTTCAAYFFFLSSFLASFLGAGFDTGFATGLGAALGLGLAASFFGAAGAAPPRSARSSPYCADGETTTRLISIFDGAAADTPAIAANAMAALRNIMFVMSQEKVTSRKGFP